MGMCNKGDEERATCLNVCFAKKFCDPRVDALPTPPVLTGSPGSPHAPGLDRFPVPQGRIVTLLRELSAHKACGSDGLSARILHECAEELALPLEIICNNSVKSGTFPAIWKQVNVIPVFNPRPAGGGAFERPPP